MAGSWALYAGVKQFQPKEGPRMASVVVAPPRVTHLLLAAAIGIAFHWAKEVFTANLGSTVTQLSILPLAVLCMLALNPPPSLRRLGTAQFSVLLVGSISVLLLNSRRDSKMDLMFSFLPVVWWAMIRRRRAMMAISSVGLMAVYLLVIAPLVTMVRNSGARNEGNVIRTLTPEFTQNAAESMSWSYASDPGTYLQFWADATMNRLCDPSAAAMIVTLTRESGFLLGRDLDYVPAAFIPRLLWRDKPLVNRGAQFTADLGWAADADSATSSTGMTSAGELYRNFGWPGVLIGMYVLGAAMSGLWWRAAGGDPRRGVLEMTAYTGLMLSCVTGTGAAAGSTFVEAVAAGLFLRGAIFLRDKTHSRMNNHERPGTRNPARLVYRRCA